VIFLFAFVPLALPSYWTDRLVPSLQPYIPQQLLGWLAETPEDKITKGETRISLEELVSTCSTHQYTSQIISLDPLVIYINDFISVLEAEELIDIG
jgi:prolyl 4-hydroxylase